MSVVFTAGNDVGQMLGAWMCWQRWCWEEFGRDLDHEAWMHESSNLTKGGCFLQIIAWDGGNPVGMVNMVVVYDAMRREQIAYGDKAWVHPDYRRGGVYDDMLTFFFQVLDLMGVSHTVAPLSTGSKATAPFLKSVYERHGFEQVGINLEREAA